MLQPIGNRVLVQKEEKKQESHGFKLPESALQRQFQVGTVIAVGEGRWDPVSGKFVPFPLNEGDRLLFSPGTGVLVTFDDKDYQLLNEQDILGVLRE